MMELPTQQKTPWEKKDRDIQIAQAVNLAVQELSPGASVNGISSELIKKFARKYDKILTELKGELK